MGTEDDHSILFAGKTHDVVVHNYRADGGVGGEGVFFELIVLEMVLEELLSLYMARACGPAWTDGGEGARVLIGFGAVEMLLGGESDGEQKERDGCNQLRDSCFPQTQKRDRGHPAVMQKYESGSFAPLTPLRGAPSCSAEDDTGLDGLCFPMSQNRDMGHPGSVGDRSDSCGYRRSHC